MNTELTIGFLPLVDACLPILAHEHGFAEEAGVSLRLGTLPAVGGFPAPRLWAAV